MKNTDNTKPKWYAPKPKDGRERRRRSFVVTTETANKFSQVARLSGVLSSDLLQQVMEQTVDAWEREHGPVILNDSKPRGVDLSAAIQGAASSQKLKRGPKPKPKDLTAAQTPKRKRGRPKTKTL